MKFVIGLGMTMIMSLCAFGCGAGPDEASAESDVQSIQQELGSNALTKQQASTVLSLVDSICGDTWCEGDHNFHFDRIECARACGKTAGTCRLTFRLFPYDSDVKTGPTYTRSCKTLGFTGFAYLEVRSALYASVDSDLANRAAQIAAVTTLSGNSVQFQNRVPRMLSRNFAPGGTIDISYKDQELETGYAKALGVPLLMANLSQQVYQMGRAQGLNKEDGSAIIKVFERMAGVTIGGDD